MCPEELLLLLHSLPLPSQKKPFLPPAPWPHPAPEAPARKKHQRQGSYLSGSCHTAWRLSPCPKAPLGVSCPRHHPHPSGPGPPHPVPQRWWGAGPGPSGSSGEISLPQTDSFPARGLLGHPPGHESIHRMQPRHRPKHLAVQGKLSPGCSGPAPSPEPPGIPHHHHQHRSLQTWLLRAKTRQEPQSLGGSSLATKGK